MMRALLRGIRRRIALKLTLTLVAFVALTALAAGLYLDHALDQFAVESLESRLVLLGGLLHDEARELLRDGTAPDRVQAFVSRASRSTSARVTLIAGDGRVVGESERPSAEWGMLDNHRNRPEVKSALDGRPGRDLRRSMTTHAALLYVALPVKDSSGVIGVLRLALPLSLVTASYAALHQVMWVAGAVALIVAFVIGLFVAGRVTRPVVEMQSIARQMSQGNFRVRAPARSPDEIGKLGRSLNVLATRLRDKIEDLEQERAKVTAILDGMVEGVIAVDGREHVVLMNERARAIFNLAVVRGDGKPFLEVIRNAELHEVFRASRGVRPGSVVSREISLMSPAERVLQVHGVPLLLTGGAGVVLVLHDITELRRLAQVRTEFVANVSHELRTPLTAIQGYVETLLGGALDEPDNARRFLEIVQRQTERLGRLINDLTELSNIELGKVTLLLAPTRLDELLDSVLAVVLPRARAGDVTVTARLPEGLPAVRADRDRLAQILINLLDNAVKYTPKGGSITIGAAETAEPGMIAVTVVDTGIGIPPTDLPRVTERFYRVDKARSRDLGGTGLGLAIVKHLVLAHGGELEIESEVGRGTTVRFTLPMSDAPVSTREAPAGT
jgi:two-component system, OmpR family, phosphate regulon sensor histidine kinase PhoR